MQSQVSQLRRKVARVEESKRFWRVTVDNPKVDQKYLRTQLSAAQWERVEADIKRVKILKEVSRLKSKITPKFDKVRGYATGELDTNGGGSNDDAEVWPHRSQQRERMAGWRTNSDLPLHTRQTGSKFDAKLISRSIC
jgi:hypothetical protein